MEIKLEDMLPGITAEVAAKLKQRAIESLEYAVTTAVGKTIEDYIKTDILPAVQAEVQAHHAEIKAAVVAGVLGAMKAASEQIQKKAIEKLTGHEGDRVISSILDAIKPRGY